MLLCTSCVRCGKGRNLLSPTGSSAPYCQGIVLAVDDIREVYVEIARLQVTEGWQIGTGDPTELEIHWEIVLIMLRCLLNCRIVKQNIP